ncbi:MqnA/MqnD/SBP family protein [Caminibacter sp.]
MLIGHIDYLNLLPFYQFLKKKNIKTIKGVPTTINRLFENKKIEAAFISSIKAKNKKCFNAGIVAKRKVKTVLVCKGKGIDSESATSNILAKILNQNGQVVIGDKAFNKKNCIDLAALWYEKYRLPFVFALFCANKNHKEYQKLIDEFLSKKQKIPYYILSKHAKKLGISYKEAKEYLDKIIYYKIGWQEKKALRIFWKKSEGLK